MLPTTIRSPPQLENYTSLAEFQSRTPESFIGGKPVLHFHLAGAKATIPASQCGNLAIFPTGSPAAVNGDSDSSEVGQEVDIFVDTDHFTIFNKTVKAGISIPYPSISIHALRPINEITTSIWMQLEFSDGGDGDDDFNAVDLTIIPAGETNNEAALQLYEAVTNCSNLHPDPNADDEEDDDDRIVLEGSAEHETLEGFNGVMRGAIDGSLPPPMPGSGGWITADNVHEYFDEDGNWVGQGAEEELGDGAGRIRGRDEVEGDDANEDESKRARTD